MKREIGLEIIKRLGLAGELVPLKGYVYAEAGGKALARDVQYTDGTPRECKTYAAYIYATTGAKVELSVPLFGAGMDLFDEQQKIYDETNSPIRIYHHYEDGREVPKCTRDAEFAYYTKADSRYWDNGFKSMKSSHGFDAAGEPVEIWRYELYDHGFATITGYSGNARYLVIPETIDGYDVAGIADNVFENNGQIISVEMPDSVTHIGNSSFAGCSGLRSVTLSKGLTELETCAFEDCDQITEIEIPDTVKTIEHHAFNSCSGLRSVVLNNGLEKIGEWAFEKCSSLRGISIPDSVTELERGAFASCSSIDSAVLGAGLTKLTGETFNEA